MNHLKELVKTSRRTSKAAQLQDCMADVDAALSAGASRTQVLEALAKDGLVMTMDYFDITRRRIKARTTTAAVEAPNPHRNDSTSSVPEDRPAFPAKATFAEQKEAPSANENSDNKTASPDKSSDKPYDPRALKAIFAQKVDLDGYAKFAKKGKQ